LKPLIYAFGCAVFGSALGCASYPKPVESLASAEASLRTAREEGAPEYPKAALQTQLSEEELNKARALMKDDDNQQANLMLMKSHADAELAIALLREAKAEESAKQAEQRATGLKGLLIAPSSAPAPTPTQIPETSHE
jgi:hypothetical protein